jgi:hypothetical protein
MLLIDYYKGKASEERLSLRLCPHIIEIEELIGLVPGIGFQGMDEALHIGAEGFCGSTKTFGDSYDVRDLDNIPVGP